MLGLILYNLKLRNNLRNNKNKQVMFKQKINLFLKEHGALSILELDGLLAAVVSSPNIVPTNLWLSMARIQAIKFDVPEQKQKLIEFVKQFHDDILANIRNRTYRPAIEPLQDKSAEQIIADAKIWALSYVNGIKTWHDSIKIIKTKDDLKSLTDILFPIMALVAADRLRPEYDSEEEFIEFQLENIGFLPIIVAITYEFWQKRKKIYINTNLH